MVFRQGGGYAPPAMNRAFSTHALAMVGLAVLAGCGEKESRVDEMLAEAESAAPKAAPAPPPKTDENKMPTLLVDPDGIVVGTTRIKTLKTDADKAKVEKAVADLPYTSEPVNIRVLKKAKTPFVSELVWQLGKAGAKSIIIKTDARDDLAKELHLAPETSLGEVPKCSVAAMVTKTADTGVWPFEGGGGRKHRKGFAGPDLTNTEETIKERLEGCDSDVAFFSAAENMAWEHAFNMGALFVRADEKKKIKKLILPGNEPVAGRPIKLRK